jgi:hypothetical protein
MEHLIQPQYDTAAKYCGVCKMTNTDNICYFCKRPITLYGQHTNIKGIDFVYEN